MFLKGRGFFRYISFLLFVMSLGGSNLVPEVHLAVDELTAREGAIYLKSRLAGLVIPGKSALWVDIPEITVDLDRHLREPDPVLSMYRDTQLRNLVVDYFVTLTGSEQIAADVLYYCNLHGVPPLLAFSIAYIESRFRTTAVNLNPTSVDRGVFQLNNRSFPKLGEEDFFNVQVNIHHAIEYLVWCMTHGRNETEVIGIYNAGLTRIRQGIYPATTQVYIRRVQNFKATLKLELVEYLQNRLPRTNRYIDARTALVADGPAAVID